MEEMAMMQRVCLRHLQLLDRLVLKVNAVKKVLMVLRVQAVQQDHLVLQEQQVPLDQRVQQVLQVVAQLERKVRQGLTEIMVHLVSLVHVERRGL
jgi:hypothetical protein